MVSFMLRPLCPGDITLSTHWAGGWVNPRAGLNSVENTKVLPLLGIKLWSSNPYSVAKFTELFKLPTIIKKDTYI
jgi:hypothetical protein